MSTPPDECLVETDCPYCLLRCEIIAVKFPLFRPPTALFVCPSCGSALAYRDGATTKRDRLRMPPRDPNEDEEDEEEEDRADEPPVVREPDED
jgi:hypothetical protein